jgi:hypothetical protein
LNYNQNEKIAKITSQTLIIGNKHVARAKDFRGLEFGALYYFENTKSHFDLFLGWIKHLMEQLGWIR